LLIVVWASGGVAKLGLGIKREGACRIEEGWKKWKAVRLAAASTRFTVPYPVPRFRETSPLVSTEKSTALVE